MGGGISTPMTAVLGRSPILEKSVDVRASTIRQKRSGSMIRSSTSCDSDVEMCSFLEGDDAFNRANGDALWLVVVAFALHASIRVNHIDSISLGDGIGGAHRFTRGTLDAFVRDHHRHGVCLLGSMIFLPKKGYMRVPSDEMEEFHNFGVANGRSLIFNLLQLRL
jgi:hypothetical protein